MTRGTSRRLVFFGSPDAAVTVADGLLRAGHEIIGAVTQPPRRRGRGGQQSVTPVESWARDNGISVVHSAGDALEWCSGADLAVVVAYGRLISRQLLDACPMLNVHFSLLPRWRGAAPVERAILSGDSTTGVSIMAVEETLDTGDVYAVAETDIEPSDTTVTLTTRLAEMGLRSLIAVLAESDPRPVPQRGEATYARKIEPGERKIDWSSGGEEICRKVRALDAWTSFAGKRLGILDLRPSGEPRDGGIRPGEVIFPDLVAAGDMMLVLGSVVPEGKRAMDAAAWLRGLRIDGPVYLESDGPVP